MPGMSARNSGTGLFRHTWPILITAVARFDFWAGHMLGRQRMARQFFFSLSWGYKGRRFRSSGPPSFLRSDRSGHAHLRAYCSCAPPDQPLLTKPQAPSAALTGIPPNGPGPARYPSGLVFPADRGSLRRRQCADQLRHPRQLRLAGGTARCFQHSTQDPPNQRQDASGAPNQPLAEIFTASSGTIAGLATSPSVVAMKRLLVRQFYVTSSLGCGPNLSGRASAVSTSSLSADQDTALTRT
jgi:hypothetical protein